MQQPQKQPVSSNRGYQLVKSLKTLMANRLDEKLQSGEVVDLLPLNESEFDGDFANVDPNTPYINQQELDVVLTLKETARQLGSSDEGEYAEGVLILYFTNKQAILDYANFLDTNDHVFSYEIEAFAKEIMHGYVNDESLPLENIVFDTGFEFEITVIVDSSLISYPPVEIELEDLDGQGYAEIDDSNGTLMEVRRRVKVNFRGKRRVKMQCRPGFKWDATKRTCTKITGSEQAKKRKELRKAVRTKKAKGQAFKVRVQRKTKKAMRFRKALGINKNKAK